MSRGGDVYFVRPYGENGPIKIGCSIRPYDRMFSMQGSHWQDLEMAVVIPGGFELENKIHKCFAKSHIHREWFSPTPRLLKLISDLQSGKCIHKCFDLQKHEGQIKNQRQPNRKISPQSPIDIFALKDRAI